MVPASHPALQTTVRGQEKLRSDEEEEEEEEEEVKEDRHKAGHVVVSKHLLQNGTFFLQITLL